MRINQRISPVLLSRGETEVHRKTHNRCESSCVCTAEDTRGYTLVSEVSVGFTCSSTFFLPVQTRNRGLKSGLFMKTRDASYAFTGVQLGDTIAAKASEYSASCETTKRNGYI